MNLKLTHSEMLDGLLPLEADLQKVLENKLKSPFILFLTFMEVAKEHGWSVLPPTKVTELELCEIVKKAIVNASPGITLKYKREILSQNGLGICDGDVISNSIIKSLTSNGFMKTIQP